MTNSIQIKIIRAVEKHSLIAQLVEQMTVNHWVAGSSPAQGAISISRMKLQAFKTKHKNREKLLFTITCKFLKTFLFV